MANALLDGVLPAVLSGADQVKRRLKNALLNPRQAFAELGQDAQTANDQLAAQAYLQAAQRDPKWAESTFPTQAQSDPQWLEQQASLADQRAEDLAMNGITVYHGSRHKFKKFDMNKVGSGEGAQSYGHGLYMADEPKVAKGYALAGAPSRVQLVGVPPGPKSPMIQDAIQYIEQNGFTGAEQKLQSHARAVPEHADHYQSLIEAIQQLRSSGVRAQSRGNLYKVDLPDEPVSRLLQWDASIEKQAPAVRNSIAAVRGDWGMSHKQLMQSLENEAGVPWHPTTGNGPDGSALYNYLAGELNSPEAASEMLQKAGIPGVRYPDALSRPGGHPYDLGSDLMEGLIKKHGNVEVAVDQYMRRIRYGSAAEKAKDRALLLNYWTKAMNTPATSNYVIFDDTVPKIISRNALRVR